LQKREVQKQFEDIQLQKQIGELLNIAKVSLENMDQARHDLNEYIHAARKFAENSLGQLNPQDHNEFLDEMETSAKRLVKAIKRLDANEHVSLHFWFEWVDTWDKAPKQVFDLLDRIAKAADDAKIEKKGRPRAQWKQILVRWGFPRVRVD
jgi:hypothetical protein